MMRSGLEGDCFRLRMDGEEVLLGFFVENCYPMKDIINKLLRVGHAIGHEDLIIDIQACFSEVPSALRCRPPASGCQTGCNQSVLAQLQAKLHSKLNKESHDALLAFLSDILK